MPTGELDLIRAMNELHQLDLGPLGVRLDAYVELTNLGAVDLDDPAKRLAAIEHVTGAQQGSRPRRIGL